MPLGKAAHKWLPGRLLKSPFTISEQIYKYKATQGPCDSHSTNILLIFLKYFLKNFHFSAQFYRKRQSQFNRDYFKFK